MESTLLNFSDVSLTDWLQVIAAFGACLTAFFSWKAIRHAEEISFKPVITLEMFYKSEGRLLLAKVANISREGDRWARDIHVTILESGYEKREGGGYIGPGESCTLVFKEIEPELWLGKTAVVSYTNFNMKVHELKYVLPHEEPHFADIHKGDTALKIERVA
jgi:hypothetical protein